MVDTSHSFDHHPTVVKSLHNPVRYNLERKGKEGAVAFSGSCGFLLQLSWAWVTRGPSREKAVRQVTQIRSRL